MRFFIIYLITFAVFIFGLVYFVIHPALDSGSFTEALLRGMLFGFITYSTYDLTNLATLEGWPIKITLIDLGNVSRWLSHKHQLLVSTIYLIRLVKGADI
jgi:uncharacterized membrane protein